MSQSRDIEKEAVRQAILDYVEGVYEADPTRIERSVHPELSKRGFFVSKDEATESIMPFAAFIEHTKTYNKDGQFPSEAPLALLCSIYKGENYIPRNRPEVYGKCAEMLFEKWDRSRSLYTPPLLEEHIRPLMEYLAKWIYSDEFLRKGVTEEDLVDKATEYLHEWAYENRNKARILAKDFIHFCTNGRAWVFLDTGTTKRGEKLYQFAHPTFLEYFTASYFVNICRIPEKLLDALLPRIMNREWDVMAQLAFQLQSKMPGVGDELLLAIIETPGKGLEEKKTWNLLSFAARCLDFITLRPKAVRTVCEEIIKKHFNLGVHLLEEKSELNKTINSRVGDSTNAVNDLCNVLSSNHEIIAECIKDLLTKYINAGSISEARLAIDFIAYLNCGIPTLRKQNRNAWQAMAQDIFHLCETRLASLYPCCPDISFTAFLHFGQNLHIFDLVKWHGLNSMFYSYDSIIFPVIFGAPANYLLSSALDLEDNINKHLAIMSDPLRELGNIWLSSPLPTVDKPKTISQRNLDLEAFLVRSSNSDKKNQTDQIISSGRDFPYDNELLFGAFVIIALELEHRSRNQAVS